VSPRPPSRRGARDRGRRRAGARRGAAGAGRPRAARRRAPANAGRPQEAPSRGTRTAADARDGALRIRRATAADAATVLDLVRGLAAYEGLAHEVEATAPRFRRHGFGRRPYFEALICYRGPRPIGLALYLFAYSTFLARPSLWLEDLFILPEERGRGGGRALLQAVARIAVQKGCGRMEWSVLDWNAPAIRFYRGLGARLEKRWILTRLTGSHLRRLAAGRG
jgi:GNAT superfamily N-acetyltransferase